MSQKADMAVSPQTSGYSSELESLNYVYQHEQQHLPKGRLETMPLSGHPKCSWKINSPRNQRVSTCTIYPFTLVESANTWNKIPLKWPTEAGWQLLFWTFERKITTCLPRLPPTFSGGWENMDVMGHVTTFYELETDEASPDASGFTGTMIW